MTARKGIGVALLAGLGCIGPLLVAGCAATPTQESTGEYIDDSVVTSRIKTALFRDPEVSGLRVSVETYRGQVQLSGFVDSAAQKTKAEQIARATPGVRSVTNSIVVKSQ